MGVVVPFVRFTTPGRADEKAKLALPGRPQLFALFDELTVKCSHSSMSYDIDLKCGWVVVYKNGRFEGVWAWEHGRYCWITAASTEPQLRCERLCEAVHGTQLLYAYDSFM